jgi:hypothetical protein
MLKAMHTASRNAFKPFERGANQYEEDEEDGHGGGSGVGKESVDRWSTSYGSAFSPSHMKHGVDVARRQAAKAQALKQQEVTVDMRRRADKVGGGVGGCEGVGGGCVRGGRSCWCSCWCNARTARPVRCIAF